MLDMVVVLCCSRLAQTWVSSFLATLTQPRYFGAGVVSRCVCLRVRGSVYECNIYAAQQQLASGRSSMIDPCVNVPSITSPYNTTLTTLPHTSDCVTREVNTRVHVRRYTPVLETRGGWGGSCYYMRARQRSTTYVAHQSTRLTQGPTCATLIMRCGHRNVAPSGACYLKLRIGSRKSPLTTAARITCQIVVIHPARKVDTMASKKTTKVDTPATPPVGHNVNPDHDVLIADGLNVVKMWARADKTQGSADAQAAMLMVRAHEFGFFDTINVANWHTIATPKKRNEFANIVLNSLFGIENPENRDRQRLQRIKLVVPGIIRGGGTKVAALHDNKSTIMVDGSCDLFKKCPTDGQEVEGKGSISIAKLGKGSSKILGDEVFKAKRDQPETETTTADKVQPAKLVELAQITQGKVDALSDGVRSLSGPESKALQALLVSLMGVFAEDTAGGVDTSQLVKMYKAA